MYGLATTKGLIKHRARTFKLAAAALAVLLCLSPAPAAAQGGMGAGKVQMQDIFFFAAVAVVPGQTVRVSGINALFLDGSVRIAGGHVKIFSGADGSLLQSHELRDPPAGLHTFDFGGRDILVGGEEGTGRVQLLIEVKLTARYVRGEEEPGAGVMAPSFELIDDASGKTTVWGTLTKAGPGTLVFAAANTYRN